MRFLLKSPAKPAVLPVILSMLFLAFSQCKSDEGEEPDPDPVPQETFQVAQMTIATANAAEITSRETYVPCSVSVESANDQWSYSGTGKIRGRGNSTWLWYPKKPYRIKLDTAAELLGLKAEKDWVLLADYRDPTHLMNTFVFTVGQGMELPYTNHARYVEVTLNSQYIGLYLLTEQVEQGENRVAIDKTEGLLLSLDLDDGPSLAPDAGDNFWSAVYQMPVCVKSPDITSDDQLTAIKTEFAKVEAAIKAANYTSVAELLDVQSFIDYLILQELVYNVEVAAPRSINLYRDKGGRWTMGPLWDFDAGFDFDWSTMYTGHNYFMSYKELVLGTSPLNHTGGYTVPGFFTDLFRNKQFVAEYKARWLAVKDKIMSEYWVTTQKYADGFTEAIARDAKRWPIDKTNATEIGRLKSWLNNRVSYLTTVISNYPAGTN